jgi:hypothetical protein
MTIATILGNGKTREKIDLDWFKQLGPIFGCNAAFRTIPKLDYLVAIDDKIIGEILESSFPRERFIVPPVEEQYEPATYSPFRRRENAGMCAMREAIKRGANTLYCLGFDFIFEDAELNMANLYDGTFGYGPETRASIDDCANRMLYLDWFASKNWETEFLFIFPSTEESRVVRPFQSSNIKIAYIDV